MKFIDFLKEKEADFIKAVGLKDWQENKVYFIDEIIKFVEEYERLKNENNI